MLAFTSGAAMSGCARTAADLRFIVPLLEAGVTALSRASDRESGPAAAPARFIAQNGASQMAAIHSRQRVG
jgi:hypothetical protein